MSQPGSWPDGYHEERAIPGTPFRYYEIDQREGFILLCTAKPRSDMTIRTHQKVAMQRHRLRHKLPTPRGDTW